MLKVSSQTIFEQDIQACMLEKLGYQDETLVAPQAPTRVSRLISALGLGGMGAASGVEASYGSRLMKNPWGPRPLMGKQELIAALLGGGLGLGANALVRYLQRKHREELESRAGDRSHLIRASELLAGGY